MLNTWTAWIAILLSCLVGLGLYIKNLFNYWKSKNVPYVPFEIPSSNTWLGDFFAHHYHRAKKAGYQHLGLYSLWVPTYMPIDPKIIKSILSTDFNYFSDRGMFSNEKVDPVGAHLFVIEGQKWRNLRAKLTPTFTSGKMKMMFQIIVDIGNNLKSAVGEAAATGKPANAKNLFQCFTIDVIGSCAFGLDCNSFKNPDSDFRNYGKKVITESNSSVLKSFFGFCYPNLAKFLQMRTLPKDCADFFIRLTKSTVEYREENNVSRKDFLQLLIDMRGDTKTSNIENGFTIEELAAQSFIFFIAGFESSSSTMTFCLYELAHNPDIQEKVRAEVNHVLSNHNGEITYDAIMDMKYLEQVIDETLRKYPIVPILNRNCVADYKIANTDVVIDPQTLVFIPVYGLHHDPEYFPNPEKFDPDRFSPENKSKIVPFTYLPFGDGPRNCIGLRFGMMQVKVGLVNVLQNFSFTLNDKTRTPLKMDPKSFVSSNIDDVLLNVKKV